jgi:hypothetical protein
MSVWSTAVAYFYGNRLEIVYPFLEQSFRPAQKEMACLDALHLRIYKNTIVQLMSNCIQCVQSPMGNEYVYNTHPPWASEKGGGGPILCYRRIEEYNYDKSKQERRHVVFVDRQQKPVLGKV